MADVPVFSSQRTDVFVLSFQLESLCDALRLIVQTGSTPGKDVRDAINNMRNYLIENMTGKTTSHIPAIAEDGNTADMLIVAELVRGSLLSMMSPDEIAERGKFGFR